MRKMGVAAIACLALGTLLAVGVRWWVGGRAGQLVIQVKELPAGAEAHVRVQGPSGFARHVEASQTFNEVPPGKYTVTIGAVPGHNADLYAPNRQLSVTVQAGATATATVDYSNVVPHTTKVLDAHNLGLLSKATESRLEFSSNAPLVGKVAPGDVLAVGAGLQTPHGLLRRVLAVYRGRDGHILLDTRAATLRDAMPKGRIDIRNTLLTPLSKESPKSASTHSTKASTASEALLTSRTDNSLISRHSTQLTDSSDPQGEIETGSEGTFTLASELGENVKKDVGEGKLRAECGKAVTTAKSPVEQIQMSGRRPHIKEFYADWDWDGVHRLRYSIGMSEKARLILSNPAYEPKKCEWRWDYPETPIPVAHLVVEVGPIPLVFTLEASMVGSLGLSGKIDLSVDFSQKAKLTAGIDWKDGHASPISSFSNEFKLNHAPSFTLEGSAKAGMRLGLKLYDTVGPYLDITPGVKLSEEDELKAGGASKLELRGGIYTSAGLDLKPWGLDGQIAEISDLYHQDKVLYSHEWNAPPPQSPNPSAGGKIFDLKAARNLIESQGLDIVSSPKPDNPGPLRAFGACACGGDGSVTEVFYFYDNRYVGLSTDPFNKIEKQDGKIVTISYPTYKHGDGRCCASGPTAKYSVHWSGSQLVGAPSSNASGLQIVCWPPKVGMDVAILSVADDAGKSIVSAAPAVNYCSPYAGVEKVMGVVGSPSTYQIAPDVKIELLSGKELTPAGISELEKLIAKTRAKGESTYGGFFAIRLDPQGRITRISQIYHP